MKTPSLLLCFFLVRLIWLLWAQNSLWLMEVCARAERKEERNEEARKKSREERGTEGRRTRGGDWREEAR